MAEGLKDAYLQQVDKEAERERTRFEFLFSVIEDNEPQLREAFSIDESLADEVAAKKLYESVNKAFNWIATQCTRSFGVEIYQRNPGNLEHPYVSMGWGQFHCIGASSPSSEAFTSNYILSPTPQARDMVNELRRRQGYETLEAQRERQRQAWRAAANASNSPR